MTVTEESPRDWRRQALAWRAVARKADQRVTELEHDLAMALSRCAELRAELESEQETNAALSRQVLAVKPHIEPGKRGLPSPKAIAAAIRENEDLLRGRGWDVA